MMLPFFTERTKKAQKYKGENGIRLDGTDNLQGSFKQRLPDVFLLDQPAPWIRCSPYSKAEACPKACQE
jgi:hypothetical protein